MMDQSTRDELEALRGADPLVGDPRPGTKALRDSALGRLGIELLVCSPERVAARMRIRDGAGAGPLLVLAETAASTAAGLAAGDGRRAFGAELNAAMLAPALPGEIIAAALPMNIEANRQTWRIVAIDHSGAQVLEARCTLGVVDAAR